jgi:hypothetical protein
MHSSLEPAFDIITRLSNAAISLINLHSKVTSLIEREVTFLMH